MHTDWHARNPKEGHLCDFSLLSAGLESGLSNTQLSQAASLRMRPAGMRSRLK